jgi:hypothetical protein
LNLLSLHYLMLHVGQIDGQVVYGIKVLPKADPYIAIAEKALEAVAATANPGAFLVDVLPICESDSLLSFDVGISPGYVSETCARVVSRRRV